MAISNISLNKFESHTMNPQRMCKPQPQVSFKGLPHAAYNKATDGLAKCLGKLADTSFIRRCVDFFNGENCGSKVLGRIGKAINIKQKWFQHAVALEGVYLTSCYMYNTKKSKSIPEDQKKPMMVNQGLVAALCTTLAYTIDNKITNWFGKVKHLFTITNVTKIAEQMKDKVAGAKAVARTAGDIDKAIKMPLKTASGISNGISKLKSVLVFGFIYRYFSPVFITPIANRVSAYFENKNKKEQPKQTMNLAFSRIKNY